MKNIKNFFINNKKGIAMAQETIGWWIIALVVLGIMLGGYFYLRGYLETNILDTIKNMFRFGG